MSQSYRRAVLVCVFMLFMGLSSGARTDASVQQKRGVALKAFAGTWKSESAKPGGPPTLTIAIADDVAMIAIAPSKAVAAVVFSTGPRDSSRTEVVALVTGSPTESPMTVISQLGPDRLLLEMYFSYSRDNRSSFYFSDTFKK